VAWHQEGGEGLAVVEVGDLGGALELVLVGVGRRERDAAAVERESFVLGTQEFGRRDDAALLVEGCVAADAEVENEHEPEEELAPGDDDGGGFGRGGGGWWVDGGGGGVEEGGEGGCGDEMQQRQ